MNVMNEKWLTLIRLILTFAFGFTVIFVLRDLAKITMLNDVTPEHSAGVGEIIGGLTFMSGAWANHTFQSIRSKGSKEEPK